MSTAYSRRLARSIAFTFVMLAFVMLGMALWVSAKERAVEKFPEVITTQHKTR